MTSQISSSPSVLLPSLSVISCRPLFGGPAIARQLNHSTKTQISDLENVSFWYICRIQQSSSLVGDAGHVHGNCHTPKGGASTDHIGLESLLEFTSKTSQRGRMVQLMQTSERRDIVDLERGGGQIMARRDLGGQPGLTCVKCELNT